MLRSKNGLLLLMICFGLLAQFFLVFLSNNANAYRAIDDVWSWTQFDPMVVSVKDIPIGTDRGGCRDMLEQWTIDGELEKAKVCFVTGGNLNIGYVVSNSSFRFAVSFAGDNKMYKLYGIDGWSNDFYYSPITDTLFSRQYLANGIAKSLAIYKNASSRLSRQSNEPLSSAVYYFDSANPTYVVSNSPELFNQPGGYPLAIGGMRVSNNGKWVAVEIRDGGIGLLNVETLQLKKITDLSPRYGFGFDPIVELAISNNAANIAVMGQNAGFSIYDVDDNCGNIVMTNYVSDPDSFCKKSNINLENIVYSPNTAYDPIISDDGGELSFSVNSYTSNIAPKRVTIQAAGYYGVKFDYIALGDSFTSGEGELDDQYYINGTNIEFEKCHLSYRSYPYLLMGYWGLNKNYSASVACSGATTNDILGDDGLYWGQGGRLANRGFTVSEKESIQSNVLDSFLPGRTHQINFIKKYQPQVISIGIGGNDAGLIDKLKACLSPGTCYWAATDEGREKTAIEIRDLFDRFVKVFSEIHQASPYSKIYAIGYPKIIDENGSCDLLTGILLDRSEKIFMNENVKYLNQVISAAAYRAGIKYIDIYDSFGNSVLCGNDQPSSMNAIRNGDDFSPISNIQWLSVLGQESFHPTPAGHLREAQTISGIIGYPFNWENEYCYNKYTICPDVNILVPLPSKYLVPAEFHNYPLQHVAHFIDDNSKAIVNALNLISLGDGVLQPNSIAQIEVSLSDYKELLGEYNVSDRGALNANINLPENLSSGNITIHILGTATDGSLVDLYQVINYQKPVLTVIVPVDSAKIMKESVSVIEEIIKPVVIQDNLINNKTFADKLVDSVLLGSQAVKGTSNIADKKSEVDGKSANQPENQLIIVYAVVFINTILNLVLWIKSHRINK